MYCTATHLFFRINQTYLHYHVKACCTATTMSSKDVLDNPSQPCENLLYINLFSSYMQALSPSQPCENLLYINFHLLEEDPFEPSQPCENLLYINRLNMKHTPHDPSQPCENLLYINLNQWHYRLLRNFNLATNDKDVIPIHLYFRL